MQTQIKVESGIPYVARERKVKYPINEMGIGDSFLYSPAPFAKSKKISLGQNVYQWNRKNGKKFAWNEHKDGLRVWRIK